jgi:hypothetical protein
VLLGASVIWLALWMLRSKSFQPEAYRDPTEAAMAPMVRPALATPQLKERHDAATGASGASVARAKNGASPDAGDARKRTIGRDPTWWSWQRAASIRALD